MTYTVKSEMFLLLKYNEFKDLLLKHLGNWSYLEYATPYYSQNYYHGYNVNLLTLIHKLGFREILLKEGRKKKEN